MSYLLLIVSMGLLVVGANWLVDGASNIARRFHLSEYIIGATIVGMGTSMPEFVVSSISSFEGRSDIAIGNVVGSNIFNVFLILGITAQLMPIRYTRSNLRRDIPLNVVASLIVIVLCYMPMLWGGHDYQLGRFDGIILLILFAAYMIYSLKSDRKAAPSEEPQTGHAPQRPVWLSILGIVGGLAGLIIGGDLFVEHASRIARQWGISEAFIGLTIVAAGTSLPELASSVIAAAKHKGQMALGNIVGSNLFNLLLILGFSATIHPLQPGDISLVDWGIMLFSSICLWIAAKSFQKGEIDRKDGFLFVGIYLLYMSYLFTTI